MIPTYLKSLAATVRDLVASGKAVHVTNETAAELDLLAGLPWNQAPLLVLNERITAPGEHEVTARPITPADLALGWLLASRALSQGQIWHDREITCQEVLTRDRQRAAECAELAAISALHVVNGRLALECLGTGIPLRTTEAHDGTREGARAAWDFIARHSPEGSQYERERDRQDLFDPEPLEGSFPPINDGNQEALRQLTQEP